MILKHLKINKLFNHYQSEIYFSQGINVIVGPNGSGKTSIVESIMLALYATSFKPKKVQDIFFNFTQSHNRVLLETSQFKISRNFALPRQDFLILANNQEIQGRENITKLIEENFVSKHFFTNIVYSAQDKLLEIVEFTPKEKEEFVNKALSLDYITEFMQLLTSNINSLKAKKTEIQFLMKKLEASKENRRQQLLTEIQTIQEQIAKIEPILKDLQAQKEAIDARNLFIDKKTWVKQYFTLKREFFKCLKLQQEFENKKQLFEELKQKKSVLETEIKHLQEKIVKYKSLLEQLKCPYCERELLQNDITKYENLIASFQMQQVEYMTLHNDISKSYQDLEKEILYLKRKLSMTNPYTLKGEITKIRQKCLQIPSFRELRIKATTELSDTETKIIKKLEEIKNLYNELQQQLEKSKWEMEVITNKQIKQEYNILQKDLEKTTNLIEQLEAIKRVAETHNLTGELRWIALSQTQIEKIFDIFGLGSLNFDKNFNFYIDSLPLHLCSGSQKVATALAIKVAFLNLNKVKFLILDEPTLFLDKKRIEDLKKMLELIVEKKLVEQVILITHEESFKSIANNIIQVEKTKEGEAIVKQI